MSQQGFFQWHEKILPYYYHYDGKGIQVWIEGKIYRFKLGETKRESATNKKEVSASARSEVVAPMPGKILKINAKMGDRVNDREPLFVMESMKMELNLVSPIIGSVIELYCKVGDLVDMGKTLAIITSS